MSRPRTGHAIEWRSRMKTWVGRLDKACSWTSLGTTDKEIAQQRYDRWLHDGVEPPAARGRGTFKAESERIMKDAAKEAKTPTEIRHAKDRLGRLRRYTFERIGMVEVGMLEPSHVASVLDSVSKVEGRSAATLLAIRSDISQILVQLMRESELTVNVAIGVSLPKTATIDARLRVSLSDEQILIIQAKRGYREPIDMMIMLTREVAGHRTSDIHAARYEDMDLELFAWMHVRRPKTDGESGSQAKVGRRKRVRAYQKVRHEVAADLRPHLREYWIAQGRPKRGPLFPTLRAGVGGTVHLPDGRTYERTASEPGSEKRQGTSYADKLRQVAWECECYLPLEGFDPARPDKQLCALQTDTDQTRRLDFQSLRRDLVTALAAANVSEVTQLAVTGHTQLSTQQRHYLGRRVVAVPDAARPGRKKQGPPESGITEPAPAQDAMVAAMASMAAQLSELSAKLSRPAPEGDASLPSHGSSHVLGKTPSLSGLSRDSIRSEN